MLLISLSKPRDQNIHAAYENTRLRWGCGDPIPGVPQGSLLDTSHQVMYGPYLCPTSGPPGATARCAVTE